MSFDIERNPVCALCPAWKFNPETLKHECHPEFFTGNHGRVKKLRPYNCPSTRALPGTTPRAMQILRERLRR